MTQVKINKKKSLSKLPTDIWRDCFATWVRATELTQAALAGWATVHDIYMIYIDLGESVKTTVIFIYSDSAFPFQHYLENSGRYYSSIFFFLAGIKIFAL